MVQKKLINLMLVTAMISFVICCANIGKIHNSYTLIVFYPLLFAFSAAIIGSYMKDPNAGGRLTVTFFLALQWLRCVLLPVTGAMGGYFLDLYDPNGSVDFLATVLFVYEMILTTLFCCVLLKYTKRSTPKSDTEYSLLGSNAVYMVYILFAAALFIRYGREMYSFLRLSFDEARASSSDRNVILYALIGYGLNFLVIIVVNYAYKKYRATQNGNYFWLALAAVLLRISIISAESESRLSILYIVFVYLFLLPRLFPERKKTISRSIVILGLIVIGFLSVYKMFNAYLYGSYSVALEAQSGKIDLDYIAREINVNFYGVKNIARNIYIANSIHPTYSNAVSDVINNIFLLGKIIPVNAEQTSALYNLYIYYGNSASGHLFSSLAYGFTYFGAFLAPFSTVFNIAIAAFFESKLQKTRFIDVYYILGTVFVRCAYTIFACFPMAWNFGTRTLLIGFLIIGGGTLFSYRKVKDSFS